MKLMRATRTAAFCEARGVRPGMPLAAFRDLVLRQLALAAAAVRGALVDDGVTLSGMVIVGSGLIDDDTMRALNDPEAK